MKNNVCIYLRRMDAQMKFFLIINFLPLFLAFDANSATSQICTIFSEFCPFVRYDAKHKYPSMDYGGV